MRKLDSGGQVLRRGEDLMTGPVTAAIVLAGSHVWRDDSLESLRARPLIPLPISRFDV